MENSTPHHMKTLSEVLAEKGYTEADMRKAWDDGNGFRIDSMIPLHPDEAFKYFIRSLNKGQKEKLVIELEDWDHTCGDGCCYSYGTAIKVNGVEIEGEGAFAYTALQAVLEHLGYEVDIR